MLHETIVRKDNLKMLNNRTHRKYRVLCSVHARIYFKWNQILSLWIFFSSLFQWDEKVYDKHTLWHGVREEVKRDKEKESTRKHTQMWKCPEEKFTQRIYPWWLILPNKFNYTHLLVVTLVIVVVIIFFKQKTHDVKFQ